jgi:hypothetical protein
MGLSWFPGDDFGRLGQLMLNDGTYRGEQVIAKSYMQAARSPSRSEPGLGYLTWLNGSEASANVSMPGEATNPGNRIASAPRDMFYGWGGLGQFIFVIPSLGITVTRTSGTLSYDPGHSDLGNPTGVLVSGHQGRLEYEFFKLLMQALTSPSHVAPYQRRAPEYVDTSLYLNPPDTAAPSGIGPQAAPGCNPLGCDGEIAGAGTAKFLADVPAAYTSAATEMPTGIEALLTRVPDLPTRLAEGWSDTAQIMGQELPNTTPALLDAIQRSAEVSAQKQLRTLTPPGGQLTR